MTEEEVDPAAVRRVFLLGLLPMLGVVLFMAATSAAPGQPLALLLRASHRTWRDRRAPRDGWRGVASHFAARHVGLPVLATIRRRRSGSDQ